MYSSSWLRPRLFEPGHPLDTFRRENDALKNVIATMRGTFAENADLAPIADAKEIVFRLRQSANDFMDIDKHYQRKEHTLFSCLERHGIAGPSKVMWSKDDEVRNLLKQMNQAAHDSGSTVAPVRQFFAQYAKTALSTVEEMVFKEENILFPMPLQTPTQNELGRDMVRVSAIWLVPGRATERIPSPLFSSEPKALTITIPNVAIVSTPATRATAILFQKPSRLGLYLRVHNNSGEERP